MAPKRKAAAAATSASQPTPQRPNIRGTRKRRHSDAGSELSEAASITSSKAASTTSSKVIRRTTRQTATEVMEQVAEQQESSDEAPPACDQDAQAERNDDEIELSQPSKRARLSSSPPEDIEQTTTSQHKMTIKWRKSSDKNHSPKMVRMSRTSFGPNVAEPATATVQDFTFSPLSTVLQKRMHDRKPSSPNGRIPDDDEEPMSDRLVLDTLDEIVYPEISAAPVTPIPNGASETDGEAVVNSKRVSDDMSDKERKRFSDAVVHLQREANDAKAKLRVQSIQIQELGFGDFAEEDSDDDKTELAFKKIRQSLDSIRTLLETELPGSLPDVASNEDILSICIANIREFANRLRWADREALNNAAITTDITNQLSYLLDCLTDEKLKSGQLRKDHDVAVERLTASLKEYIEEEKRLKELITRMESEHRDTFVKINGEREKTVRGLEAERDSLSKRLHDTVAQYENLQGQVKVVESERDTLNEQLENIKEDLDAEIDAKESAEADLAAKETELEELQGRVNTLDEEIEDLNLNLDSLRSLKDSENSQRLAAESELDNKMQDIEVLEEKLLTAGKEANELRAKIFELQNQTSRLEQDATQRDQEYEGDLAAEVNRREAAVELAEAREAEITQLEKDLENTEERMAELLAERDARVNTLEGSVVQKDTEMQGMEADHKVDLEQREETIAELRTTIEEFEDAYQNSQEEASDYKNQLQERETTVADLQEQVSSLEQDKTSLEGRVDKEAMHALELTNTVFALEAELKEREEKLAVVHEKRANEEKIRKKLEEAKDAEIAGVTASYERKVEMMQEDINDLKRQFVAFIRQAEHALVHRQEARRERLTQEDAEDEALKAGFLKQLDALNGTITPTTVLSVQQQQKVVTRPQRKRKRQVDSGIGLDGEGMEEEMVGA